jgi:hypothetical protein
MSLLQSAGAVKIGFVTDAAAPAGGGNKRKSPRG